MPRFYFHRDGDHLIEDQEGSECPDLEAAREEAINGVREILAEAIAQGREPIGEAVLIVDDQSRECGSVRYVDVLPERLTRELLHGRA